MNNPRQIPRQIPSRAGPGESGYSNGSGVPQPIRPPAGPGRGGPPRPDARHAAARNTHDTINQLITRIVEGIGVERAGRTAFTRGLTQSIAAIQESVNNIRQKLGQLRARGDNVEGLVDILNAIQRRLTEEADALDRGAVVEDPDHQNAVEALQRLIQDLNDDVDRMLTAAPGGNTGSGGNGGLPPAAGAVADAVGGLLGRMGAGPERPEPRGGGRGLRRRKTRRLIRRVNRRKTRREKNKKNKKGGYKYTKTRRSTRSRSKSKTPTKSRKTNSRSKSKNYVKRFF